MMKLFRMFLMPIIILLTIGSASMAFFQPKIFRTFATKKEVGWVGIMGYDGSNYWFRSSYGLLRYDPGQKKYFSYDFGERIDNIGYRPEPVMCMSRVKDQMWFGLHTKGMAVYNAEQDNFVYYGIDDGIPYYQVGNDKYSKVTAISYDEHTDKVWIGTIRGGLAVYNRRTKVCHSLAEPKLKGINVSGIVITDKNVIIAGEQIIYVYDKINNIWEYHDVLDKKSEIRDIIKFDNDSIALSVRNFDDKSTGNVGVFSLNSRELSILPNWNIWVDDIETIDNYLILAWDHGISFYNIETKKIKTFNTWHGLISRWVNDVFINGDDIWVTTQDGISIGKVQDVLKALKEID